MANIVFMGTPVFAVPSLDLLVASEFRPVAVVTGPDREKGRGRKISETPVKRAALGHGISTILQPESVKDPGFAQQIESLEPDLIIVVAFRILPPSVFTLARLGAINLHGSLLPRYRGAAPIHRAVMAGEPETGVTTFFLKERVDTGQMILQRSMPIHPDETTGDIHDRMMTLGADVVLETTKSILDGTVETTPQDDSLATPAPKIHREDCHIDWDSADTEIHNFIRGLSPYPGAWTHHQGKELKIFRSRLLERADCDPGNTAPDNDAPDNDAPDNDAPAHLDAEVAPGTVIRIDGDLYIACGKGAIEIIEIQQEGKRRMAATDFVRGSSIQPGDVLV
ncbi:MAG: methionyl-tRNA formyltransferase [Rhodothermia bacterium]|nr:MAG: methionyl-tRNA formyltransferase [Rhodothermia bacterium]